MRIMKRTREIGISNVHGKNFMTDCENLIAQCTSMGTESNLGCLQRFVKLDLHSVVSDLVVLPILRDP